MNGAEPEILALSKLDDGPEDLLRRDIDDAGKPLPAFLGVMMDAAARTGNSATNDVAVVLVTPFVPVVSCEEEVDDICAA